ncbi:MAG: hypothetical protein HYV78_02375 [Candidatus Wildermuthbacteria bacterium]|nr:hypothetical protein [Candidatus Wildermuthbacteria bacterium]
MEKLVENFGLDWKLLFAQAFNFLLVLWILRRFAFSKLLSYLEIRRKKIQEGLEMHEKAGQEIARAKVLKAEEIEAGRREAMETVARAKKFAEQKAQETEAKTREKAEEIMQSAKQTAEQEKKEIIASSADDIKTIAEAALEKILARDISKTEEEKLMGEVLSSLKETTYAK